jgi:site-specific recombinase XerD
MKGSEVMAERSKKIDLDINKSRDLINAETVKLFKKYKMDMEIRELSPKTIYNYETDLYQWFTYVYENQGNQSVIELDEEDITEFIYFCKQEGNNSRRIKRRMSSISAFYKYLRKKKLISENPMEFIDRPKKDVDVVVQTFLTEEQVALMKEKLQEYVDNGGMLELQVYALFSLSTMARVNAVANIRWEQIDFENRVCSDVLEKEGKIVNLYFNKEVSKLLQNLKKNREKEEINDGGYVFYSSNGGSVSTTTLSDWAKKVGNMIDVPTLHPHDFRHSGSQLLKLQGMPIEMISELLNHSGLDVTKKFYLRQDKKKLQEAKDKFTI